MKHSPKHFSAGRRRAMLLATSVGATMMLGQARSTWATSAAPTTAQKRRIADGWYAHNAIMVMLGATDRVVATVARPDTFPWMYRVAPKLHQAQAVSGNRFNGEDLLSLHTDLVFVNKGQPDAATFRRLGLETVEVGFDTFASLLDCVDVTAKAIGSTLALQRAAAYRSYFEHNLARLASVRAKQQASMPRVLHIASLEPLKVDGSATLIDAWITAAGGRNAATGVTGNLQTVSMEQVLEYDPDVVILAANAGVPEQSKQSALWPELRAVGNKRVYRNPAGVFPWDRYGPEAALQLLWAPRVFHQDGSSIAEHKAMISETISFYRDYFDYPLSAEQAARILNGLPPA